MTSLINVSFVRGEEDELIVEELMEDWPETEEAIEALKQRVLNHPLYPNLFISEDGKTTAMIIKSFAFSSVYLGI